MAISLKLDLRGNITIVYEQTVCPMLAFSMCMLRIVFNIVSFWFLNHFDAANCRILSCLLLHNQVLKQVYILLIFNLKEVLWHLIYPNTCIREIICIKAVISLSMTSHKYTRRKCNVWREYWTFFFLYIFRLNPMTPIFFSSNFKWLQRFQSAGNNQNHLIKIIYVVKEV